MKKTAVLLASLLLMITVLAGCTESTGKTKEEGAQGTETTSDDVTTDDSGKSEEVVSSKDKVTISLLSWYTEEQLGEFISAFEEENPGVTIDVQFVPPVQQYVDKFSVLVASGQMTDMFYTGAENKQDIFEKGLAEDLSYMEIFNRIDKNTSATYGNNGEIYAYSPDAWIGGLFYNKAIFEEAGIDKIPETWDEFIDCCKKLKDYGVEPYLDYADGVHGLAQSLYQCMVISKEPDADVQINEGNSTFVEKYTEPLTIWYNDMISSGLYSQVSLGLNSEQLTDMFVNGEVAMMYGGPWDVATIENSNPDLDYDIFGLSDKEGNSVLGGAVGVGLSISTSSDKKEECRAFIEFMARDENILKWQKLTNNVIIVDGVDYSMDTVFEKFKEDAIEGNFYLPPIVWKNSAGIYKEFLTGIQDAITGADTIENIPVRMDEKQAELDR